MDGEPGPPVLSPRFVGIRRTEPKMPQEGHVELSTCGHLSLEEWRAREG